MEIKFYFFFKVNIKKNIGIIIIKKFITELPIKNANGKIEKKNIKIFSKLFFDFNIVFFYH